MTLETVAVNDPVLASTMQQLIANVNGSPGRAVFVANGTWSVPTGVHKFKVTLCGGGGKSGANGTGGSGEDVFIVFGGPGGDSPMISALFAGVDLGSTFAITVGAGGSGGGGGTSSFGTLTNCTGGASGPTASSTKGTPGTATFPAGAPNVFHSNEFFGHGYADGELRGYGRGGAMGDNIAGRPGIVVVEW